MYEHAYDDKHKMIVLDDELNELKARQKGYYEPILCVDCERIFNECFEQPCVSFFRGLPERAKIGSSIILNGVPKLDLLLMSILWRASMAEGEHWKGLKLGPHQMKLKRCLENRRSDVNYQYWVFLVSANIETVQKGLVSSVQCVKVNGHNLYHFVAGGIQFVIKISSHPLQGISPASMSFDKPFAAKVININDLPSLQVVFKKTMA